MLVLALIAVSAVTASAKMGFACEGEIHSVAVSETRVVFVVSGSCNMLIEREPTGAAAEVQTFLREGVIILHRTYEQYRSPEAWEKACKEFESYAGKRKLFQTSSPRYIWENSELETVSTSQLVISDHG